MDRPSSSVNLAEDRDAEHAFDSMEALHKRVRDLESCNRGMRRLVTAVQELSFARTLEAVMKVVRTAARELTGADGATFVLRDKDQCYYADEDAISPLWKGQRFPLSACISGWAMLNRQPAIIEDIYADSRIPADAYRPTFVKSLVMVPIRTAEPLGAIGNYWARRHLATINEIELLQALANTTAVAMESVALYQELESRVQDRTRELQAANKELETFSYSASHDLQGPLGRIKGFCDLIAKRGAEGLDPKIASYLQIICSETDQMRQLIQDLLKMSRLARIELRYEKVDLSKIAQEIVETLRQSEPGRQVQIQIQDGLVADGHPTLLRVVLENLISNAWKFTSKTEGDVTIEFGRDEKGFLVRDNGAGFDMTYAQKLFQAFQRMHTISEFPGTGVGLATVQRIILRHGGQIWAESAPGKGATFHFTLPER
jgi:signal transduction histidine kinase